MLETRQAPAAPPGADQADGPDIPPRGQTMPPNLHDTSRISSDLAPDPQPAPMSSEPLTSLPVDPALIAPDAPGLTSPQPAPAPLATGHAAPALPQGLPAALVRAATRAASDDRVELTLDPVELGRVRFALVPSGDQLQVTLSIERPETLDLLRRHAEVLRAEFRDAGFGGASLSFGQWGQGPASDRNTAGAATAQPAAAPTPPIPLPRARFAAPGLDLRL